MLPIPEAVQDQPYEAQLSWVSERVREHYREGDGKCPLFGEIAGYSWRYARGSSVGFDPSGHVLRESN